MRLSALFSAKGEALARPSGQTLARWVALNAAAEAPATVAEISRRFGFARQSVQRVADLLVEDGLAVYEDNPRHRRAKLLVPTRRGREVVLADQHPPDRPGPMRSAPASVKRSSSGRARPWTG